MFNTVLDKKMLKTIFSVVATSAVTVLTSIVAYAAHTVEDSAGAQCTLSAAQVGAVQGLVKLMVEENATCACESEMRDTCDTCDVTSRWSLVVQLTVWVRTDNMTLDSILAM